MEFKQFLSELELGECVIAAVSLDDGIFLAKNRDRGYKARVELMHELVRGTEVLLWHDLDMNEFGIGLVNSSLLVKKDEKEGDFVRNDKPLVDKKKHASDGKRIRDSLGYDNIDDVVDCLLGKRNGGKAVKGQTIVSDGKKTYVLEVPSKYDPVVERVVKKVVVRTNHGVHHKRVGYIYGEKKASSHSRLELARDNLEKISEKGEILPTLKRKYRKNPFLNPYRVKNKYNMQTTGQVLMDLKGLHLTVAMDDKQGSFKGVRNLLPKGHKAKITFTVT